MLAVGISQRTEPDAIDALAHNIFNDETSPIDTILAFNIPNNRAFMHLDTVFTQIDTDKFTIHPGIMGPLTVFEITPEERRRLKVKEMTGKLEDILEKYVGVPVELIPCGGGDRHRRRAREQWNDGSNTLCIAPGTDRGVRAQRRDQRGARATKGIQVARNAVRRALPRPRRPTLHEHAHLARGLAAPGPGAPGRNPLSFQQRGESRAGSPRRLNTGVIKLATPPARFTRRKNLAKDDEGMNHAHEPERTQAS